ncbi:MAG: hypothetical protein IRZ05_18570 [Micromonosporaceae bacterium]|jgi:hypothetical protein|nr:hypothetical protein [Micromonosporaceae bacterium]
MDQQFGALAAMSAYRRSVLSARPDAPVVPDRPARWRTAATAARHVAARALHRLADRIEPCPTPVHPTV